MTTVRGRHFTLGPCHRRVKFFGSAESPDTPTPNLKVGAGPTARSMPVGPSSCRRRRAWRNGSPDPAVIGVRSAAREAPCPDKVRRLDLGGVWVGMNS